MSIFTRISAALFGLVAAVSIAQADVPSALDAPHPHGVTVKGKIVLFRTQIKGLEIGPENDRLDAEVLVVLDSEPDHVYGIRYHEEDPSTEAIVDTLREAYLHDMPIYLHHAIAPGKKNLKIVWVQMGDLPK